MSIINSITKLLNLKEKNLIFNENFIEEKQINNKRCLIINGYLYNSFDSCPHCGCVNNDTIIKKGTRLSKIKINKLSELTSYLYLKKQVYKCKECNRKITAKTSIVDYGCYISNNVKHAVIMYAKEIMPKTLIAKFLNISDNKVQSIFDTVFNGNKLYKHYLPEAICIDEFTYKKKVFAFNMCDAKTGKTIDLIEDRTTKNLDKYFSYYTEKARKQVKFVVMDMYSPYIDLIRKWFPNALIIIDLFHIVQLLTKSLNKTRIDTMKEQKEDYNKFKRYHRLVLKSRFELDNEHWRKYRCFKKVMTEGDVVNYLISKDKILENSYDLYQDILYYLQSRNYEGLKNILNKEYREENISTKIKTTMKTLKKYSPYIKIL